MAKRKQLRMQDELVEQEFLAERAEQSGRTRKKKQVEWEEEETQEQDPIEEALSSFFAEGLITEILYTVKSGKEATVYCCQANPDSGMDLIAAKVYRSRNNRGFKNDSVYQEGRVILDERARRAVQNKSKFGREAQFGMWVNYEFEIMNTLFKAGANIPQPIARAEQAILMEYQGDQQQAAPTLQYVELAKDEVHMVFETLMRNIELWLAHNYIHADLSAYNVLYWQGQVKIIDFPQAVDPRFNPNALALLTRDIENICRYMARYGLERDGQRIAERLWRRFRDAEL